jgi:steroid 5-alpha reductase family enzyme
MASPLLMTYLLRFVSGVPMLERKYAGNAEFEAYKKKTSIFFPLPPRG